MTKLLGALLRTDSPLTYQKAKPLLLELWLRSGHIHFAEVRLRIPKNKTTTEVQIYELCELIITNKTIRRLSILRSHRMNTECISADLKIRSGTRTNEVPASPRQELRVSLIECEPGVELDGMRDPRTAKRHSMLPVKLLEFTTLGSLCETSACDSGKPSKLISGDRPPSGFVGRGDCSPLESELSRRASVRDSNPLHPDYESGALSS